jgi:hypothetical protein
MQGTKVCLLSDQWRLKSRPWHLVLPMLDKYIGGVGNFPTYVASNDPSKLVIWFYINRSFIMTIPGIPTPSKDQTPSRRTRTRGRTRTGRGR